MGTKVPASVIPIRTRREGMYVLVEAALPERPPQTIGVFLMDPDADRAWVRVRQRFDEIANPEDAEVLKSFYRRVRPWGRAFLSLRPVV